MRTGQSRLPRFQRFEAWSHNTIISLLETVLWRSLHDDYDDRTYFIWFASSDDDDDAVGRVFGQSRWMQNGTRRPLCADDPMGIHERGCIPLQLLVPGEFGTAISDWCRAAVVGDTPEDLEQRFAIERTITGLRQRVAV